MELVQLPDGQIDTIGNKQHVIDIIRERCGDDIAEIVSEWVDPGNLDDLKSWKDTFREEFREEWETEEKEAMDRLCEVMSKHS